MGSFQQEHWNGFNFSQFSRYISGHMIYFPFALTFGSLSTFSSFSMPHTSQIMLLTSTLPESIRSSALFCVYGLIRRSGYAAFPCKLLNRNITALFPVLLDVAPDQQIVLIEPAVMTVH